MSAQQSGVSSNAWLSSEMGFVYDPLLRRVRNPFDFLRQKITQASCTDVLFHCQPLKASSRINIL